jgi:hypothetical protein
MHNIPDVKTEYPVSRTTSWATASGPFLSLRLLVEELMPHSKSIPNVNFEPLRLPGVQEIIDLTLSLEC